MKKLLVFIIVIVLMLTAVGCSNSSEDTSKVEDMKKVGLVTDSGTIDDKSFNQGSWEGITKAAEDYSLEKKYLKPDTKTTADYLISISNLVDGEYGLIVTTGFMFAEAIGEAQIKHANTHFILVDAVVDDIRDNVTVVLFAEEEAGFLAGISAAVESKTGKLGFIGGMEIPPVQKFGWGFVAGVAYANETYGTKASVSEYIYEGSFDNVQGGTALAAGMYDKGVDVIFTAAGGVGVGAINEAKARKIENDDVYIIGVDVDQYEHGLIDDGSSVILTSAMKRVDNAVYSLIGDYANGQIKGGEIVVFDAKSGGVGLPEENPNLSKETINKIDESTKEVGDGAIDVPGTLEELTNFLNQNNYESLGVQY